MHIGLLIYNPFLAYGQVPWLDINDISRGTERNPIPVFCPVDGTCPMEAFTYVQKNVFSPGVVIDSALESRCTCNERDCLVNSSRVCECVAKNGGRFAYTRDGRLAPHMLLQVYYCLLRQCAMFKATLKYKSEPC